MKVWGNCVLHLMIIHWVVLIGFGFHSTDYRYVYCLFLVIANLGPLPMYVHVWCSSTPCWLADCYCRKTNLMATFPEWKSRIVLRECFSLLNHHSLVAAFRWCFYGWAAWCGIPDRAPHPVITIMHYMNLKIHVHVVCMQTLIDQTISNHADHLLCLRHMQKPVLTNYFSIPTCDDTCTCDYL